MKLGQVPVLTAAAVIHLPAELSSPQTGTSITLDCSTEIESSCYKVGQREYLKTRSP